MLLLARRAKDADDAEDQVRRALTSGTGLEKFRQIIEEQGGDPRVVDDYNRLPAPSTREVWRAPRAGIVARLDAELVGRAAVVLGAGRDRVDADVDASAGIDITAPVGTRVAAGDPMLTLLTRQASRIEAARRLIDQAVAIGPMAPVAGPAVIETIDGRTAFS
jgi:pyrimidine-nucleoside phosphorylase